MHNKLPYTVPEGYFSSLSSRLSEIPSQREATLPHSYAFRPYLAIAACIAAAILLGGILLRNSLSQKCTDDEIIEYLIDSGTTLAYIQYSLQDN